jgi:NADH-quinone oxidoreductase subunit E
VAQELGMTAPDASAETTSHSTSDDTKAAAEVTKDEPAPGPSADVPPKSDSNS